LWGLEAALIIETSTGPSFGECKVIKIAGPMANTSDKELSETINELSLAHLGNDKLILLPNAMMPYRQSICSYIAAMLSTAAGFPLDSVKTRLQTHKFNSAWHCIVDTKKNEGLRGFYRGLTAPLMSASVVRSISVTVYGLSVPQWSQFWFSVYGTPSHSSTIDRLVKTTPVTLSAGAVAGMVCSVISCPFEFTKLASQIELLVLRRKSVAAAEIRTKGAADVAREIVQKAGLTALYAGYRYHFLRDFIGSGVYFCVYENFKIGLSSLMQAQTSQTPHPISVAIGGAMAGTVCWTVVYPIDTYKSMVQRDIYSHAIDVSAQQVVPSRPPVTLASMFRPRMYRGLGLSIARTSLIGMVFFSCYEQLIAIM
jgi:hypothetical protein